MAEMRAYRRSLRDYIGDAIYDTAKALGYADANQKRKEAQFLTDFVPGLGEVVGADEVKRDYESGNWLGGTVGLAALGVGAVPVVGDALGAGMKKGIRAYHGSPHDFDRFDMSKIGTGEGAQAYGHGLYFAENEGVARNYRDALGSRGATIGGKPVNTFLHPEEAKKIWDTESRAAGITDDVRQAVADKIDAGLGGAAILDDLTVDFYGQNYDEVARILQGNKGRMYEVNIDANPDDFLDWDKPLSEQPESAVNMVREALKREGYLGPKDNGPRQLQAAMKAWRMEKGGMSDTQMSALLTGRRSLLGGDEVEISKTLKEAGIPGIKYLDAGSRGAGDGSRNYVVFDDKLISIVRKYGVAALVASGVLTQADAEALKDQGYQ